MADGGIVQDGGATEHEFTDCPSCDGNLQYQSRSDVMCLDCEEVFHHQIRNGEHLLRDFDWFGPLTEVVARAE